MYGSSVHRARRTGDVPRSASLATDTRDLGNNNEDSIRIGIGNVVRAYLGADPSRANSKLLLRLQGCRQGAKHHLPESAEGIRQKQGLHQQTSGSAANLAEVPGRPFGIGLA